MNTQKERDLLLGALIGLVRVCGHKERTTVTDRLLQEGLTLLHRTDTKAEDLTAFTSRVHEEKLALSPGCAVCQSPCGGTADYDLSLLHREEDLNVLSMKTLLIYSAEALAARKDRDEELLLFLYRSLMAVGDDAELSDLLSLLMETGPLEHRADSEG